MKLTAAVLTALTSAFVVMGCGSGEDDPPVEQRPEVLRSREFDPNPKGKPEEKLISVLGADGKVVRCDDGNLLKLDPALSPPDYMTRPVEMTDGRKVELIVLVECGSGGGLVWVR